MSCRVKNLSKLEQNFSFVVSRKYALAVNVPHVTGAQIGYGTAPDVRLNYDAESQTLTPVDPGYWYLLNILGNSYVTMQPHDPEWAQDMSPQLCIGYTAGGLYSQFSFNNLLYEDSSIVNDKSFSFDITDNYGIGIHYADYTETAINPGFSFTAHVTYTPQNGFTWSTNGGPQWNNPPYWTMYSFPLRQSSSGNPYYQSMNLAVANVGYDIHGRYTFPTNALGDKIVITNFTISDA